MQIQRQAKRVEVDIPIIVATVLDTAEATIADLTELGALIVGVGLPEGTRIRIEYRGQTVFAQCRWSEIDRMGVKFLFQLTDGPLYERLLMARTSHVSDEMPAGMHMAMAPTQPIQTRLSARTFGRATMVGNFGRRAD